MSESDLRDLLAARLAARLGLDPAELDLRERFSRYGLDSAGATSLVAELSAELGRELSPTLIWAYPSVEELARFLAGNSQAPSREAVPAPAREADEPIAIVGVACRFPGAPDWPAFWRMLCAGVDATGTVPPDRWDADAWYDPDPQAPGKISTRRGAFLDHADRFDPLFFGISPREACEMDPQQRLMLELCWEALEDAGIPPRSLQGSQPGTKTGVFAGVIGHDYAELHRLAGATITSHTGPGNTLSIVANRVSYLLGLRGPSLTVDTACSSSLVAVHLACQSLRSGECSVALAGGVNYVLSPGFTVELTKFGGLSGDGRCKAFDARADGFARGEGGGIVVLKPLSAALRDGDPIWCLIRGGAVNNDGASNGLTAPSPQAQVEVLADACARAGVDPLRVHYVEAHGTGTRLGDPIEARSLAAVLCPGRDPERPLVVGSAKTNIAHLEGAAGIAGLIKLALAIRHRQIPPSLHFETPNPDIPFGELRLRVATGLEPWPAPPGEPAVGGVSSFGWGGTNCHLVLEELPASRARIVALEAESEAALRARVLEWLQLPPLPAAGDGPAARAAISFRSPEELADRLSALLEGQARPGLATGGAERHGLVFVFSGMGAMWPGLGRDLLREQPLVRARLEQCDRLFRPWTGRSILEDLVAEDSGDRWHWAEVAVPALFALQVALADLWRSWGIEPDAVIGHSGGEIAAATVAGGLTLEEGVRVSVVYSRTLGKIDGQGAIAVLELSPEEAQARLAQRSASSSLEIAGHLSPTSVTVAGPSEEVDALVAEVKAAGRFAARVAAKVAAHTSAIEPHLDFLREGLAGLTPRRPAVPLVSTLTGGALDRPLDGDYWAGNLRRPVLFAEGVAGLRAAGFGLFLEIDAHPVLATPLEQGGVRVLPSMRRREDPQSVLLDSLGALWAAGRPVDWEALHPDPGAEGAPELLPLSARTPEALRDLAEAMAALLREPPAEGEPAATHRDVARAAAVDRTHHEHRLALTGRSRADLAAKLDAFAAGEAVPGLVVGRRARAQAQEDRGGLVFVFAGQGPQWPGMGRELLSQERVFRETFEQCDELLRPHLGESLFHAMDREGALDHTAIAQPALFALEVSLAMLWRSWGIVPDAVAGHSVGEIAAAWAAGILSLEEAARVAAVRGRSMEPARGHGAMAAVELSEQEVQAALRGFEDRLCVAAVNSPSAVTVAGDPTALEDFIARLQTAGATARRLRVEYAFHSPQMEPCDREVEAALADLRPRTAAIPLISTVTGLAVAGPELDAAYWRRNVRQPVRFAAAIGELAGHAAFLEVGPHPVLAAAISQVLEGRTVLASLRRGREERETIREALAGLYVLGAPVDWSGVFPDGGRFIRLPTYPFQRQRYWFEAGGSASVSAPVEPAPVAVLPAAPLEVPEAPEIPVERLLEEQLDAFNRMVGMQLDLLSRVSGEHL